MRPLGVEGFGEQYSNIKGCQQLQKLAVEILQMLSSVANSVPVRYLFCVIWLHVTGYWFLLQDSLTVSEYYRRTFTSSVPLQKPKNLPWSEAHQWHHTFMGSCELMADNNLWTTCNVVEEQCCTGVGSCVTAGIVVDCKWYWRQSSVRVWRCLTSARVWYQEI